MSVTTWYVLIGIVITVLSVVVGAAMHTAGGSRGLVSGTAVYMAVVVVMAAVATIVILVVRSTTR